MKRPEGFDRTPKPAPAPAKVTPIARAAKKQAAKQAATDEHPAKTPRPSQVTPAHESRALVRRAKRERKAFERKEVRRFTRRSRSRRAILATVAAAVALLLGGVTAAVFSPFLALETIEISGTQRLDPATLRDAIDDQVGTPLALLDVDRITTQLAAFPLVRSFTTEAVPPNTLRVTIVEREAIGVVVSGSEFAVVDPAGIVIERVAARPEGYPLIDAVEASTDDRGFSASVAVLLALPDDLLARVDGITATTTDDVAFTLAGGLQTVRWGSADRSEFKARVLAGIIATQDPSASLLFDVSAPDSVVVRTL